MSALAMTRESPEIMAKLTIHGPSLVGGRGGRDRLTAQDVAAAVAMAHLSEGAELLAFALGCQDAPSIRNWHSFWLGRARRMNERWREPEQRVTTFALMTSVDVLDTGLCTRCNGAGRHQNQRDCAACEGTGRRTNTAHSLAQRLEVPKAEWDAAWSRRYALCMHRLSLWQSDADRALARTLRD